MHMSYSAPWAVVEYSSVTMSGTGPNNTWGFNQIIVGYSQQVTVPTAVATYHTPPGTPNTLISSRVGKTFRDVGTGAITSWSTDRRPNGFSLPFMLLKNKSTNPETLTFIDRVQHNIPAFFSKMPPNRQLTGPIERLDKSSSSPCCLRRCFERQLERCAGWPDYCFTARQYIHGVGVLKLYVGLLYCLQHARL